MADYGFPFPRTPNASSRVVPRPYPQAPFSDTGSSIERIRAAQQQAAQAEEEQRMRQQSAMDIMQNTDINMHLGQTKGDLNWMGQAQRVDGSVPTKGPEDMRAPGAPTFSQVAGDVMAGIPVKAEEPPIPDQPASQNEWADKTKAIMANRAEAEMAPLPGDREMISRIVEANRRGPKGAYSGFESMSDLDRANAMKDGIVTNREIAASLHGKQTASDKRLDAFEQSMLGGEYDEQRARLDAAIGTGLGDGAPVDRKGRPVLGGDNSAPMIAADPDAPGRTPPDPIQENFDRQNKEWQAFVDKHGMAPEEMQRRNMPDSTKKNQYFNTMSKRWRNQFVDGGPDMKEMEAAYDEAFSQAKAAGHKNPHVAATTAVNQRFIDNPSGVRNRRDMQLDNNVQKRNEQYALAQAMSSPRGISIFMDSMQEAKTPEARYNVLMTAFQFTGNPMYAQAAMQIQRGQADADALAQWQGGKKPELDGPQKAAAGAQAFMNMPLGEDQLAAAEAHSVALNGGQPLAPDQRKDLRKRTVLQSLRVMVANGQQPSPQQIALLRSEGIARSYDSFAGDIGLPRNDPKTMALWKEITGTNPPAITPGGVWEGLSNGLAGIFGGAAPQNQAQAQGK